MPGRSDCRPVSRAEFAAGRRERFGVERPMGRSARATADGLRVSSLAVAGSLRPALLATQIELLAEHGEERTAAAGDVLFRVGDRRYPLIVILEGEAAI